MACPLTRTADGYELQFATNHLGHFLLTNLLVPALKAGAPARIVNVSSLAHTMAPLDFGDIHFERRRYGRWIAYGQSKTANVLFTVGLDQRLRSLGITALALHPGVIMTNLVRHLNTPDPSTDDTPRSGAKESRQPRRQSQPAVLKSVEQGAATTLYAAVHPSLAGRGGLYLEDCQWVPSPSPMRHGRSCTPPLAARSSYRAGRSSGRVCVCARAFTESRRSSTRPSRPTVCTRTRWTRPRLCVCGRSASRWSSTRFRWRDCETVCTDTPGRPPRKHRCFPNARVSK